MKRTLNSTTAAKKIAMEAGLTFTYNRSTRSWELAPRHADVKHMLTYAPSAVADIPADAFYLHCMEVAALNMTPEQMNKVVMRYKHRGMLDMVQCEGRDFTKEEFAEWLAADPYSTDKQVHEMEHAIYNMIQDAEEVSGAYADHKAAHAAVVVEEIETITAQPVCVPGEPLPAAFIVFTSWTRLAALHPTVAGMYELRRVADGPVFPGAIYPVRVIAPDNVWVGEPCATQAEAERAALAHLRTPVAVNRYWITACNERGQVTVNHLYDAQTEGEARAWAYRNVAREQHGSICVTLHSRPGRPPVTVDLRKADAPECVAHLVNVPLESNRAIMARAVAFVRDIRLTAEYLAAHDGDDICRAVLASLPHETVRALAVEQARADAARTLSGVAK